MENFLTLNVHVIVEHYCQTKVEWRYHNDLDTSCYMKQAALICTTEPIASWLLDFKCFPIRS